jgi:hypothetical protein
MIGFAIGSFQLKKETMMSETKKGFIKSFKQGFTDKFFKDVHLPKLFVLATLLRVICLFCAAPALFILGYTVAKEYSTAKSIREILEHLMTARNFHLMVLIYCAQMMDRPAVWLSRFAETPYSFFVNTSSGKERYQPFFWMLYWLLGMAIIFSVAHNKLLGVAFQEVVLTDASIFASLYLISILCIVLLQYYKRLMTVHT